MPYCFKSGFKHLDEVTDGFISGGMYIVAGNRKSGKSSLVLNFVKNFLSQGNSVCYASTELTESDIDLFNGGSRDSEWMQKTPGFHYVNLRQKPTPMIKSIKLVEEVLKNGETKILIVDNLTSYGLCPALGANEWMRIAIAGEEFRLLADKYNVVVIAVIHFNKGLRLNEIPLSVKKFIQASNPSAIFDESVSVYRQPTGDDIKGGEAFISLMYGNILLWRPYQDFEKSVYNKLAMVIVEAGRYTKPGRVKMYFDGETHTFTEVQEEINETYELGKNIFTPSKPL